MIKMPCMPTSIFPAKPHRICLRDAYDYDFTSEYCFSWKAVGMSALAAGVTAGVGGALSGSATMASIGQSAGQMGQTMAQAAIGNIASQGIMTATGLQHSFDWRGVAASAAAAGVGYAVGTAANAMMDYSPQANGTGFNWSKQFASNTVSGIAAGTTYAKLHGDEINAGRLVLGAAAYGAASASATEQKLMNAQREAQQAAAMQRAINAPGITEAGYWNQSRTMADQYVDTFGGDAIATRGPRDRLKLGGGGSDEVEAIALQRRANDLADTLNDMKVTRAMQEGRDLAPTVANAAALGLLETSDHGLPRPFNAPSDPQWLTNFQRGYADPNDNYGLGVMSPGTTAAQMAGQFVGGTVDAFTQMGRGMIGANNGNAAYADFAAGRYVQGTLHSMQAIGEAGMTVMGLGGMAPAARSTMAAGELGAARNTYTSSVAHPLESMSPADVIKQVQSLGVQTERDELLLWSGLGRGREGIIRSQTYAVQNGGRTLEMTPGGQWLDKMDLYGANSPFTQTEADHIWGSVSRSLVEQASGQVRALQGAVRPSSVFRNIELPALQNNTNITGLESLYLKPRYNFKGQ